MTGLLSIGVLQAPFGLKGDLKVKSLSGETDHFLALQGQNVVLRQAVAGKVSSALPARTVESVRIQVPSLLIKFKGIDSPEDARTLTGCEILVERERASQKTENEYYVADLVGSALLWEGKEIGTVLTVWETGAHDMLEVRLIDTDAETGFRLVNVPFRSPFVGDVDTTKKTIELLTPWVLD